MLHIVAPALLSTIDLQRPSAFWTRDHARTGRGSYFNIDEQGGNHICRIHQGALPVFTAGPCQEGGGFVVVFSEPKACMVVPAQNLHADTPRTPRRRVLKSGIIAYNDRFSALLCTVRDLSECGAHLRVEDTVNVPNTFELIIELDGLEASCEVVWRKNKEIGVRFSSPPRAVAPRRTQVINALAPKQAPTLRRKALTQQR